MIRILIFILLPFAPLAAQNYVMNGSFERARVLDTKLKMELSSCAFSSNPETFNLNVDNWHTYKLVTPDIFWIDTTASCEKGLPKPRSGTKMLGLIMYLPGTDGDHEYDYHEYVEGRLAQSLSPGQRYRVSFWVREAKKAGAEHVKGLGGGGVKSEPVNCGNFGFYFATEPSTDKEDIRRSIFDYGIKPQVNFKEIINTGDGWVKMSAVFVPDRPFRYFIFGNFFSDGVTPNDLSQERHAVIDAFNAKQGDNWKKIIRMAYYCFDDFSVTVAKEDIPVAPTTELGQKLVKEKKISLSATLLFEVDKASLKPAAGAELDALVTALKENKSMRLEIGGHTDNTGSEAYNLDLSERRASAVRDYLVLHGVDFQRLAIKGYGASVPVTVNTTVEGRAENRRVECKVL